MIGAGIRTRIVSVLLAGGLLGPFGLSLCVRASAGEDGADRVELSNGEVLEGRIRFTKGKKLILDDAVHKRKWKISPDDVVVLAFDVESESMEYPYTFEMPGSREKTYGDVPYPIRNFTARVTLKTGETFQGHLMSAVCYLTDAVGKSRKFFLRRQQKGRTGQTLEDLRYVTRIRFGKTRASTPRAAVIQGVYPAALQVVAYGIQRGQIYEGTVTDPETGAFEIGGLPPDTYDLGVLLEREIVVGMSNAVPDGRRHRPLEEGDVDALALETAKARDFFEFRKVSGLSGTRDFAKALTYLERENPTSNEQKLQGDRIWHVEIWLWHILKTRWRLDQRLVLFRGIRREGEVIPQVIGNAAIGGIVLRNGERKDVQIASQTSRNVLQ